MKIFLTILLLITAYIGLIWLKLEFNLDDWTFFLTCLITGGMLALIAG